MTESDISTHPDWRYDTDEDGITWLGIDKADGSANVLSRSVLEQLSAILDTLERIPPNGLVLHSRKRNGFVMGADINEFGAIESVDAAAQLVRAGQKIMDRVEALPFPSVAVINGFALGGGLELAMACDYRVALATDKKIIGFPEVQLGLHPGFGGTVRALRLSGVRNAMQLMLTGKPIVVSKAKKQGLIDEITSQDHWQQSARDLIAKQPPKSKPPLLDRVMNLSLLRPLVAKTLRKQVASKARQDHYPAPYAIIDLWQRYGGHGPDALPGEAESFAKLLAGSTAQNLVRVFFLQNGLKSQGNKTAEKVRRVHVVGAGVMGGDIAAWCALRGLEVTLQDREEKYIQPALERADKLFGKRIRDEAQRAQAKQRLRSDVEGSGAADADLVIEAIFENLEAKKSLYDSLQRKMKSGAILATNTSSIRLEDLRDQLQSPQRFIGVHFFNPVAQLPLVEVIHCADTESQAMDVGLAFVKSIGKLPLQCTSSPGFVVNRVLGPYMAEAMQLMEEGVDYAAIDAIAENFGMPMGPVELLDSVGLDVALHVSQVLGAAYNRSPPKILPKMVENRLLGRKSGQGFYLWKDGRAVKKTADRGSSPADGTDRLILPMVNEAVATLYDGVVENADLVDAGVIFGTGFAPFRGGPLQYARERGVTEIVARLEELAGRYGERFLPHQGWSALR
jgi:3-hydroxyacyl-CoA dehydrogenase/enoyl-CoA hydratase/3-hydroxybutyryl-CoA epimerase